MITSSLLLPVRNLDRPSSIEELVDSTIRRFLRVRRFRIVGLTEHAHATWRSLAMWFRLTTVTWERCSEHFIVKECHIIMISCILARTNIRRIITWLALAIKVPGEGVWMSEHGIVESGRTTTDSSLLRGISMLSTWQVIYQLSSASWTLVSLLQLFLYYVNHCLVKFTLFVTGASSRSAWGATVRRTLAGTLTSCMTVTVVIIAAAVVVGWWVRLLCAVREWTSWVLVRAALVSFLGQRLRSELLGSVFRSLVSWWAIWWTVGTFAMLL